MRMPPDACIGRQCDEQRKKTSKDISMHVLEDKDNIKRPHGACTGGQRGEDKERASRGLPMIFLLASMKI